MFGTKFKDLIRLQPHNAATQTPVYLVVERSCFSVSSFSCLFTHLHRSGQVGKFNPQVDLAGYRQPDEQPVIKAEIVDQLENVGHRQVEQRHAALQGTEAQCERLQRDSKAS